MARFFSRQVVLLGFCILSGMVITAIFFPWLSDADPNAISIGSRLQPPSLQQWAGSDELGRDVLVRIIHGAGYSLMIGACTASGAVFLGTLLGMLAGFLPVLDALLMRGADAMMSFPDVLLGITLVSILGPSLWNVVLALTIVYTPRVARVVRASTLVLKEMLFVDAARALGVSTPWILWRHVLPNLISPILVQLTFIFAYAILAEAGLSFLGVGVPPQTPTWGTMIAGSLEYSERAIWVVACPGLAIILTALSLQWLGDGVRDLLDPRLKKAS